MQYVAPIPLLTVPFFPTQRDIVTSVCDALPWVGSRMTEVTRILTAADQGDTRALDQLLPLVYEELRQLAAKRLAQEKPGQTLQATALVHEVYLRLVGSDHQQWDSRWHFFAAAAEAMRRILVDYARRKNSMKRGGGRCRLDLVDADLQVDTHSDDLIALDEALTKLAETFPQHAELVELRYFAGMTGNQAAKVLGISPATAERRWRYARSWLYVELGGDDDGPR